MEAETDTALSLKPYSALRSMPDNVKSLEMVADLSFKSYLCGEMGGVRKCERERERGRSVNRERARIVARLT